jgi:hypothetical protein
MTTIEVVGNTGKLSSEKSDLGFGSNYSNVFSGSGAAAR